MKSQSPHLIFVSCYQSDLPEVGNTRNHYDLLDQLRLLSVPYMEAIGCYKGKEERTIILEGQYARVADMIMREYNQESYLEHHNDRQCDIVYANGARDRIGEMQEVSEQEARKLDAWTSVTSDKGVRFFTVK